MQTCRPPPPPPPPPSSFGTTVCQPGSCGANSPTINLFPINGIRSNGDCNPDGVQLIAGSLNGRKCHGATLDLSGNTLVGRDTRGTIVCSGSDLLDATFEVQSSQANTLPDSTQGTLTVRIAKVTTHGPDNLPAYRLERADDARHESLCTPRASNDARLQLGVPVFEDPGDAPTEEKQVVIAVSSELYDRTGTPVKNGNGTLATRDWLNLACVGDALAERSLNHMLTDDLKSSRAALLMLTANYCGDNPFTMRGTNFQWGDHATEIEAIWSDQGAVCLNKPRVIYRVLPDPDEVPAYLPPRLKNICGSGNEACSNLETWLAAAHQCRAQTRKLPSCDGIEPDDQYVSYPVYPSDSLRFEKRARAGVPLQILAILREATRPFVETVIRRR